MSRVIVRQRGNDLDGWSRELDALPSERDNAEQELELELLKEKRTGPCTRVGIGYERRRTGVGIS